MFIEVVVQEGAGGITLVRPLIEVDGAEVVEIRAREGNQRSIRTDRVVARGSTGSDGREAAGERSRRAAAGELAGVRSREARVQGTGAVGIFRLQDGGHVSVRGVNGRVALAVAGIHAGDEG